MSSFRLAVNGDRAQLKIQLDKFGNTIPPNVMTALKTLLNDINPVSLSQ